MQYFCHFSCNCLAWHVTKLNFSLNVTCLFGMCRMHGFLMKSLTSEFEEITGVFSYIMFSSISSFSPWSSRISTPHWIGYPIEKFCPGEITNCGGSGILTWNSSWNTLLSLEVSISAFMRLSSEISHFCTWKLLRTFLDLFRSLSINSRKLIYFIKLILARVLSDICTSLRTH